MISTKSSCAFTFCKCLSLSTRMILFMNILFILFVDDANGQPCEADWEDRVNEGLDCLLFDSSHSNHDKSITFCSGKGANLIGIESEIELTKLSDIMIERRAEGRW